jgi:hypothetical protein
MNVCIVLDVLLISFLILNNNLTIFRINALKMVKTGLVKFFEPRVFFAVIARPIIVTHNILALLSRIAPFVLHLDTKM